MNSSPEPFSIRKCEHCQNWTNGNKVFCAHCGEIIDDSYRKEMAELEQKQQEQPLLWEWFKLKGSDSNPVLRIIGKFIQSGQAVLMGLISLITLLLLALPG